MSKLSKHQDKSAKRFRKFGASALKSGRQMFGYMYLAGRELNQKFTQLQEAQEKEASRRDAENAEPNGWEQWLEKHLPDVPLSKVRRYREFATQIEAAVKTIAAPAVGATALLTDGVKKLTAKQELELAALVPQVMGGKGMMEFMEDMKFLAAPKKPGFRPNAEALAEWVKKNHPELEGTEFETWLEEIQEAFKAYYFSLPKKVDPKEFEAKAGDLKTHLLQSLNDDWLAKCSKRKRDDLLALTEKLLAKLKSFK